MASAASFARASTAAPEHDESCAHHSDIFPTASAPSIIDDAASAVKSRWAAAATMAGDADQAVLALSVLCDAVRIGLAGGPIPSLASHTWTAEGPRLLTALRRELIAQSTGSSVPAAEVIRVLQQIEQLCLLLEQDASAQFAEHVLGPNALQLLVEVAHDMRSPLTSIQFLVERMRAGQTGPVSPMQERHLGLVYAAAFGLSGMASDVTELAQGGARLVGPAVVPFSISEVLHAVRDVVQPIAEEKRLTVRFSGPPVDVRLGHPAALHRVLLNLVTNALKFTNSGAVTVQAESAGDSAVRFLVADTGRGMPPLVTARFLNAPAEGAANHDAPAFSSAGLGLAICQKLIGAMRGDLALASSDGRGTRLAFTLDLPAVSAT